MKPLKKMGLLASEDELLNMLKEQVKYQEFITDYVKQESGLTKTTDLIIYLAEKYHPKLRIKHKVGAKTKWNDHLNCIIASEVDSLKRKMPTRKAAIEALIHQPPWSRLLNGSKDPFGLLDKAEKAGKKSKFFIVVKHARKYAELTDTMADHQKSIEELINNALKKN